MSANDLIYKETLAAADKLNADLQIKLLKLYAAYNEARDTIERIRKRAIFRIPSYAYLIRTAKGLFTFMGISLCICKRLLNLL